MINIVKRRERINLVNFVNFLTGRFNLVKVSRICIQRLGGVSKDVLL